MLRDAARPSWRSARARTDSDLDHLARECHQAVGATAAEAAVALTEDDLAPRPGAAARDPVQEMREKLERMGPVNVLGGRAGAGARGAPPAS
mgnify:CR=1 FL=1